MQYYVRDEKGRVAGPFSVEALKKAARTGRILPSWHISSTRQKWTLAARVPDLFETVDQALTTEVTGGNQYRDLTRKEQIALFVDKFVFSNEHFKDSMPWLQHARAWWARLTLPSKGFVIAEITPTGITHVRYDFDHKRASAVGEDEFERNLRAGIRQSNWFTAFAVVVASVWGLWTLIDLVGQFSLTVGTLKLVLFLILMAMGYIYKTKRTKVFIGYVLAPEAEVKLKEILRAFAILRRCNGVWAFQVQANTNDKQWKYNGGGLFSIAKLPIAIFNRPIPNIETNIKVCGVAYNQMAIYFLPEKLLVINGTKISHVPYNLLGISPTHMEYVETQGHVYADSLILERRWKYINRDGSPDRRFKANHQVPLVRCGILDLDLAGTPMCLLTSDPNGPEKFCQTLPRLDSMTRLSP
jgi:hypothetical protein